MRNATRADVEREGREWQHVQLAIEAKETEAAGHQLERSTGRFQTRLQEIGSDFGLLRR